MFKAKAARVAAFVLIATGAAVFISCQDGTTAPAPPLESKAPSFDVVRIWGYVEDEFGIGLKDADVEWWCNTCSGEVIGNDAVDDIGRYDIDPPRRSTGTTTTATTWKAKRIRRATTATLNTSTTSIPAQLTSGISPCTRSKIFELLVPNLEGIIQHGRVPMGPPEYFLLTK